jgi:hypothetical protein
LRLVLYKWLARIAVALGLLYISLEVGLAANLSDKLFWILVGLVGIMCAQRAGFFR